MKGKAGRDIPAVMVTSPDGTEGIEGIPATILKEDMRQAIRDLKDKLKESTTAEKAVAETESRVPDESMPKNKLFAQSQQWTNAEGKPITAAIKSVKNGLVLFVMPGGREVPYPLAKLSEDSRNRISEISSSDGTASE